MRVSVCSCTNLRGRKKDRKPKGPAEGSRESARKQGAASLNLTRWPLWCVWKMVNVVFPRKTPQWIVSSRRARTDSGVISRSCHCIIGERLLRLRAEGQVQGLRSVTPSLCLSFVTTLKTATHPCVFFPPPPRAKSSSLWSGDIVWQRDTWILF